LQALAEQPVACNRETVARSGGFSNSLDDDLAWLAGRGRTRSASCLSGTPDRLRNGVRECFQ
jgi:hypothetical protein